MIPTKKYKYMKMHDMPGSWIRVVRHCPDMTKTFVHDVMEEVASVAGFLSRGIKCRVGKPSTIYDDRDRQWVSVLIRTDNPTKLNRKILDYDGEMKFSDVGFRFNNTRINVSSRKLISYDHKTLGNLRKRGGGV